MICFYRSVVLENMRAKNKKISTTAGFEPARAEPIWFLVIRLNHSAILSTMLYSLKMKYYSACLALFISCTRVLVVARSCASVVVLLQIPTTYDWGSIPSSMVKGLHSTPLITMPGLPKFLMGAFLKDRSKAVDLFKVLQPTLIWALCCRWCARSPSK